MFDLNSFLLSCSYFLYDVQLHVFMLLCMVFLCMIQKEDSTIGASLVTLAMSIACIMTDLFGYNGRTYQYAFA